MKLCRQHRMFLGCLWLLVFADYDSAAPPGTTGELGRGVAKRQELSAYAQAAATGLSACSPDGNWFVLASQEGTLRYGRTESGEVRHTFYHCAPRALVFSADGRLLVCAGASKGHAGAIKVWELESGRLLCTAATELPEAPSLAVSPDGLWLVGTTGKGRLNLWQISDGQSRWSVSLNRAVKEVSFTKDCRGVRVHCADSTLRTLALLDGAILSRPESALNP